MNWSKLESRYVAERIRHTLDLFGMFLLVLIPFFGITYAGHHAHPFLSPYVLGVDEDPLSYKSRGRFNMAAINLDYRVAITQGNLIDKFAFFQILICLRKFIDVF